MVQSNQTIAAFNRLFDDDTLGTDDHGTMYDPTSRYGFTQDIDLFYKAYQQLGWEWEWEIPEPVLA